MVNSLNLTHLHTASVAAPPAKTAKQYLTSFLNSSKQLAIRIYQLACHVFAQFAQVVGQMTAKTVALFTRGLKAVRDFLNTPSTNKIRALEAQLQAKNAEVQQLKADATKPAAAIPQVAPVQAPALAAPLPNDADFAQAQVDLAAAQGVIARLHGEVHQLRNGQNLLIQQQQVEIGRLQQANLGLEAANGNLRQQVQQLPQMRQQINAANPALYSQ